LHQRERVEGNFIDKLDALMIRSVIDASLEHATAMTVSCNFYAICSDSIVDKLIVFGSQLVQTFLNYMIAVQIFDQDDHM
jgi:hypothetical protein